MELRLCFLLLSASCMLVAEARRMSQSDKHQAIDLKDQRSSTVEKVSVTKKELADFCKASGWEDCHLFVKEKVYTQAGITVSMLQALRDAMLAAKWSWSKFNGAKFDADFEFQKALQSLAEQRVSPKELQELWKSTEGQYEPEVLKALIIKLAMKHVSSKELTGLYEAYLEETGHTGPAYQDAADVALGGGEAKLARSDGAVRGAYDGVARRYFFSEYEDGVILMTAAEWKADYEAYFHDGKWYTFWKEAPNEQKVGPDQKAYTIMEWIGSGHEGADWKSSWEQLKPATLIKVDLDYGELWDMGEFAQKFGHQKEKWAKHWTKAVVAYCEEPNTGRQFRCK